MNYVKNNRKYLCIHYVFIISIACICILISRFSIVLGTPGKAQSDSWDIIYAEKPVINQQSKHNTFNVFKILYDCAKKHQANDTGLKKLITYLKQHLKKSEIDTLKNYKHNPRWGINAYFKQFRDHYRKPNIAESKILAVWAILKDMANSHYPDIEQQERIVEYFDNQIDQLKTVIYDTFKECLGDEYSEYQQTINVNYKQYNQTIKHHFRLLLADPFMPYVKDVLSSNKWSKTFEKKGMFSNFSISDKNGSLKQQNNNTTRTSGPNTQYYYLKNEISKHIGMPCKATDIPLLRNININSYKDMDNKIAKCFKQLSSFILYEYISCSAKEPKSRFGIRTIGMCMQTEPALYYWPVDVEVRGLLKYMVRYRRYVKGNDFATKEEVMKYYNDNKKDWDENIKDKVWSRVRDHIKNIHMQQSR